MMGSVRLSLKCSPRFRSSRDRLLYRLLRRCGDGFLERRDLDFPFRLGRSYVQCSLLSQRGRRRWSGTSVIGNSRQKLQRGLDVAAPFSAEPAAEIGTVEGLTTAPVLRDLSYRLGIELPITEGVCKVLDGTDLHELAASLMGRQPTRE
jgi:hypothetical protein